MTVISDLLICVGAGLGIAAYITIVILGVCLILAVVTDKRTWAWLGHERTTRTERPDSVNVSQR
jgi:hypothetical protein